MGGEFGVVANPKSAILGTPLRMRMLAGLMSRWMIPKSQMTFHTFLLHFFVALHNSCHHICGKAFIRLSIFCNARGKVASFAELGNEVGIVGSLKYLKYGKNRLLWKVSWYLGGWSWIAPQFLISRASDVVESSASINQWPMVYGMLGTFTATNSYVVSFLPLNTLLLKPLPIWS